MNYSVRYLDIKNRPMFQLKRGMGKLDVILKLVKIAAWTAVFFVIVGSWIYFVQNWTLWGVK